MNETASAMHLEARSLAAVPCDTCGTVFTPRRGWGRFCSTRCRNAFHGAEKRKDAIRAAALRMYDCLADFASQGNAAAAAAIEGLKPPVEPKALLEKAKA